MPTSEGYATAFLAGFLFLLATNLMAGWLFFLVAFLVALLLVGFLSGAAAVRAVQVEMGAATVRAEEEGEIALPLTADGVARARFLRIAALVAGRRGEAYLGAVRRGERHPLMLRLPAPGRGAYPVELDVISHGLIGLFRFRRRLALGGEVLVRPRFQLLGALPAVSGREEGALLSGRRRGDELAGTREYLPGDPARHVHWRSSHRHRRLIVKEFDDPAAPAAAIVLDADAAQTRERFDQVVRAAASLAHAAARRGLDVTLAAVLSQGPVYLRGGWERLRDGLARLTADGPPLAEAMARLGPVAVGSMLVVTAGGAGGRKGAILIGPEGAETPWVFDAEGGVRQRWRA